MGQKAIVKVGKEERKETDRGKSLVCVIKGDFSIEAGKIDKFPHCCLVFSSFTSQMKKIRYISKRVQITPWEVRDDCFHGQQQGAAG
jgi:hypothetical protein